MVSKKLAATLAVLLLSSACQSMRFEVADGPVGKVVHDRKAFFLGGLAPTRNVDVSKFCPAGAVAVSEETTFLDGLFSGLTLGIYSPRSSTYHCAAEGQ